MVKYRKVFIFAMLVILLAAVPSFSDLYDTKGPLIIRNVELCEDKPRGLRHFESRDSNEFKEGDNEVYIYIEVSNCKPEKVDRDYHVNLALDINIYYDDGLCILSEEDANVFDYPSRKARTEAYLWVKIDATYLKKGEYKVEMTVKDENSDKEAFALTKFRRI